MMHFEYYSRYPIFRPGKRWYWRLRAKNGEIIAQGEGYTNRMDCKRAIELIMDTSTNTPVEKVLK